MNRKFGKIGVVLASILSCSFALISCGGVSEGSEEKAPKTYTIQYTDDKGAHTLTVEEGAVYSLESIPTRYGYEFKGLYSMENGGVQYVGANGLSTTAFQDGVNLTLYPQFEAKEYTLVLDSQGAEMTGNRSYTVSYGEALPTLPTNLSMEAKEFTGWYTEPERKGTQIADKHGVLPLKNKLNEKNFDLSDTDGNICLYAGFQGAIYDVVLHFENGQTEELSVEHDTKISELIYETRVNGKGVIAWSTQENDEDKSHLASGKIKSDLELYATEYAPVLDFNANGGEELPSIVAREGERVVLPTPERENYQFVKWQDKNGNEYTATVMPSDSMELKAIWQAKLVFDENGGTEVVDISKPKGESVSLPEPTRSGYIFAGWYIGETEYASTAMPSESLVLKAGWYQVRTETVVVVKAGESKMYKFTNQDFLKEDLTIDCSSFLDADFEGTLKVVFNVKLKGRFASLTNPREYFLYFYKSPIASEANVLLESFFILTAEEYIDCTNSGTLDLFGNKIYVGVYSEEGDNYYDLYISDFYVNISFPDTSKVIL
ncbi:MAG: InlB B-repeat-containing protein [Clostridia bacterium]|nr:InlB B-repeat-containing protein [Clostridia bacterium]